MIGESFTKMTCEEAESICTKAAYKEAGFVDKMRLKLHLFWCKTCLKYHEDNTKLSSLLKKAKIRLCSSEEKEAYRQRIREGQSDTSE